MPRGIAHFFTLQDKISFLKILEAEMEKVGLSILLPNKDIIQIWDNEGDMQQLSKSVFYDKFSSEDYLIQFWWDSTNSISLRICELEKGKSCCVIYLDGLEEGEVKKIFLLFVDLMFQYSDFKLLLFDDNEVIEDLELLDFDEYSTANIVEILEKQQLAISADKIFITISELINYKCNFDNFIVVNQQDDKKIILYELVKNKQF